MHAARDTVFARDHGFARLRLPADFQAAVPLRRFEDFWTEYWRKDFPVLNDSTWRGRIPYFAATSGTSVGTTKHIPVSHEMVRANRTAALDLLVHHVANRPQSRVLGGKNFMLGGSAALKSCAPGIAAGDISGIAAKEVPWWARRRYFPPAELALASDWHIKTERLASLSLTEDIRTIAGTPSWLLVFFDQLDRVRGHSSGRLAEHYPNLELLVHGGVNFAPYRARFESLLVGSHAELREVYPASEGFVAVADRGPEHGLRLLTDNGLFFEFVPVEELSSANPTRHWLATAELETNYALVLTTCAGLWAYVLGDTVRLLSLHPPRLLVTGRTSYGLSAFGEHLIGEEIEGAVAAAAGAIGAFVSDFCVSPVYPQAAGDFGRHLFVVEFAVPPTPDQIERFGRTVDQALCERNEDYATHRSGNFGMAPPCVEVVRPGTFAAWMKSRGRMGGQNKVPRVVLDRDVLESLRRIAAQTGRD